MYRKAANASTHSMNDQQTNRYNQHVTLDELLPDKKKSKGGRKAGKFTPALADEAPALHKEGNVFSLQFGFHTIRNSVNLFLMQG